MPYWIIPKNNTSSGITNEGELHRGGAPLTPSTPQPETVYAPARFPPSPVPPKAETQKRALLDEDAEDY